MRSVVALVLMMPLVAACTPYLPERLDFGTSAAVPKGEMPPEFSKFNNYDPNVNAELARQICATSYQPQAATTLDASPGQLVNQTGTCSIHQPIVGTVD